MPQISHARLIMYVNVRCVLCYYEDGTLPHVHSLVGRELVHGAGTFVIVILWCEV